MTIWNDTDIPLAYLITFRTYGTWLPGDERGSIDRFHNLYGSPRVTPNAILEAQHRKKLKSDPLSLDAKQRQLVESAIREVCEHRKWGLFAINVRTNHVHTVAAVGLMPVDKALNDFKSYATRSMRRNGTWLYGHSPWVDKGSKRRLWNEDSIAKACDYVINGQGADLPDWL
jgi:REP element-mobilizing transposase RayT